MPEPIRDEALEEIWASRRRIWEEAGGTWEGDARHLDEVQAEMKRHGAKVIHEPCHRPNARTDDTGFDDSLGTA